MQSNRREKRKSPRQLSSTRRFARFGRHVRHTGLILNNLVTEPCASSIRIAFASFYKHIRQPVLSASQFPPVLTDAHGSFHKPQGW